MPLMPFRRLVPGLLVLLAACGSDAARTAGLTVTRDATADTTHLRVAGDVPDSLVRRVTEEFAIAPGADDTTLFSNAAEVEVDGRGRIWVFDLTSTSLFLFRADGTLERRIGRRGDGPGEFTYAMGMVTLGDTGVAVWDPLAAKISFFDSAGTFRTSWRSPAANFMTQEGLHADRRGGFYLKRPVTAPREGEGIGRIGLAAAKPDGSLGDSLVPPDLPVMRYPYVAKGPRGSSSQAADHAPQYYWAWHPDGHFVVADGGKGEVTIVRPNTKPLTIHRTFAPVAIADEERRQEAARLTWDLRKVQPDWSLGDPPLPTTKAPILGLHAARDGRIWVRVAAPSEAVPQAVAASDTVRPVVAFRTPPVYEVYTPDGTFLGRVALPAGSQLKEADGDIVWLLSWNDDDVPAIRRMRVEPGLQ